MGIEKPSSVISPPRRLALRGQQSSGKNQNLQSTKSNLAVNLAGLKLKNPVIVSSGTFGYGEEYAQLVDLNSLGAIVTKTITLKPREGNPPPRLFETACGLLNSIGLENVGLERFVGEKLPFLRKFSVPVIASITDDSVRKLIVLAKELSRVKGISAIEINLSCPNISKNVFLTTPGILAKTIKQIRPYIKVLLIAKLGPYPDPISSARAVESAGTDVISLTNTFPGMAINTSTRLPELGGVVGGLSGPAIKPLGVRMVYEVRRVVKIPLIGGGGIMTAEDALEYILAGATAISVGTANFIDPQTPLKIISGLEKYLKDNQISSLRDIVGKDHCP